EARAGCTGGTGCSGGTGCGISGDGSARRLGGRRGRGGRDPAGGIAGRGRGGVRRSHGTTLPASAPPRKCRFVGASADDRGAVGQRPRPSSGGTKAAGRPADAPLGEGPASTSLRAGTTIAAGRRAARGDRSGASGLLLRQATLIGGIGAL